MNRLFLIAVLAVSASLSSATAQMNCAYAVPITSVTAPGNAATYTIYVTPSPSNCPLFATSNSPWIRISYIGTTFIQYTVTTNPSVQARSGSLTVVGQPFSITQDGSQCYVTAVNNSGRFGGSGGTGSASIEVTPNDCTWVATTQDAWLKFTSPNSVTGSGTLQYSVDPFPDATTRFGGFQLTTVQPQRLPGPFYPYIVIYQDGLGCAYSVSPSAVTLPASGGSSPVQVAYGACSAAVTSSDSWLMANLGSASALTVYAGANTSSKARTGTVLFGDKTVTVTQPGQPCSFGISASSINAPAAGLTGTLNVAASVGDCAWTAVSDQAFVTFTSTVSNSGNGSIAYSVSPNLTTSPRTATLTIAGQTVTILQAAATAGSVLVTGAAVPLYDTYSAFSLGAGNTAPQTRTITLNTAGSAAYTSSVANPAAGGPIFVSVLPATGTAPSNILLTANPQGLAPGTYRNVITFTSAGASATYTVDLTVQAPGNSPAKAGVYRDSSGLLLLDTNGDGTCCTGDSIGTLGAAGDIPIAGDRNGTGTKKAGLYRPSTGQFLLDNNNNATFDAGIDQVLTFAPQPGDLPVVGDWTGTGVDRAGVFRALTGTWYLDVTGDGSFTGRAYLGQSGDIPVAGKWSGAGTPSRAGIYRPTSVNGQPGNFFLLDTSGDGLYTSADAPLFFLGQAGDVPIVGDWNGDGRTKVGIFRPANSSGANPGLFILDHNGNLAWDGPSTDRALYFAPYLTGLTNTTTIQSGDLPITGDWVSTYAGASTPNVAGRTRTGIYRPSTGTFFFDVSADGTFQGRAFLGQSGDVPIGVPVLAGGAVIGVNLLGGF